MNADQNRSQYNMVFRNCANFSSEILDFYFPRVFRRHILPDGGIVTPRQVAYELVKYGQKHTQTQLTVMEIPMVPGYHRSSRVGKSAAESFLATGYVVPIAVLCPYAAGVIVIDALVWGRCPLPLKKVEVLSPESMALLATSSTRNAAENLGTSKGGSNADVENLSSIQRPDAKDSTTNATLLQKNQ
jgi:hypothetical protein